MAIAELGRQGRTEGLHHIVPSVQRTLDEIKQRAEARNRPNPLWERVVKGFEREWSTPWDYMDGVQRGLVRVMYKHEKREAAKPKPELKPVPEPIRMGIWDPSPGFGGK